jgi:hypothetical protein
MRMVPWESDRQNDDREGKGGWYGQADDGRDEGGTNSRDFPRVAAYRFRLVPSRDVVQRLSACR